MTKKLSSGSTISQFQQSPSPYHWLLIPGGPGIESQYLVQMVQSLEIDVSCTSFDLPRREAYRALPGFADIVEGWKKDLLEAVREIERPILVGHSFGAMLALSVPELQNLCSGAIFLDSSPNRNWEKHAAHSMTAIDSREALRVEDDFAKNPSDTAFKELCLAWAPFYFLQDEIPTGRRLLETTGYNSLAYQACGEFFSRYHCAWQEWAFPTLCLAGSQDLITPLSLFREAPEFQRRANVEFSEIKNAGHFPWVENFEDFADAIRRFVDSSIRR